LAIDAIGAIIATASIGTWLVALGRTRGTTAIANRNVHVALRPGRALDVQFALFRITGCGVDCEGPSKSRACTEMPLVPRSIFNPQPIEEGIVFGP
jgi:hypothetical protein